MTDKTTKIIIIRKLSIIALYPLLCKEKNSKIEIQERTYILHLQINL